MQALYTAIFVGFDGQLLVFPDAGGEGSKGCCSLADAFVNLGVEGQIVTEGGPKVGELMYIFKFVAVLSYRQRYSSTTNLDHCDDEYRCR